MKGHDNISLKQAKSDYEYISNTYGRLCDFCGSICNEELLFWVLDGTMTRKEAYIRLIRAFWTNGIEPEYDGSVNGYGSSDIRPDENDIRIQKIKERYAITETDM